MPAKHNKDYDPPWAEVYQSAALTTNNFKDTTRIPIFWGPGQLILDYPNYTPPDLEKWRKLEIIGIPQVVRFIFASKSVYQDDEYNDDDNPPPPPPVGECPEFNYEIEYSGWYVQLKSEFIGLVDLEPTSSASPFYICNYDPPYCFYEKSIVLASTIIVKNRDTHVQLYSGTLFDCPYLNLGPARYLKWTYSYPGGGGGVLADFFTSAPSLKFGDRSDPDVPPICWVLRPDGTYFSEIPSGPFSDSLGNEGVCAGPFELWGCNSDPALPPLFDPPTPPLSPPGP